MSADLPTPEAGMPSVRSRVARRNQRQMLLFAALTLLLTLVTVWGGRVWLRNSETLVFAVGDANGPEAHFAARLATVLKNSSSRFRLKIMANGDNSRALVEFEHRRADLAVLRTDAKIPPRARALAVLEHDVVLLISPGGKKIKSLADLRRRKIAVLANGDNNAAFVRNLLEIADVPNAASRVQMAPLNSTLDKLLAPGGYGAVIAIAHASTIAKDKIYQQYAGRGSFTLNSIDESKALTRRNPA
ncbi:MAG TPA: C4-dicarboxylate ABC transporter substrate-binding protein, partial [Bradyrhizobium sp.]